MVQNKFTNPMLIYILILGVLLINSVSAVDIQVWQGKYLTGSANTVYTFNFTVYDDIIVGESCWSNTVDLTTDSDRWWFADQIGVAYACNDANTNYYLNIEINGADQVPRRLLKELKYADLSMDNIFSGKIVFNSNVNVTGNMSISGKISSNLTPSLNNTFSLGSPDLLWKDLYLGNSSIYLGDYILDVFGGNFRIRNETTNIMYFNATGNEMVFTTNTRTIGFAEGASPLKLREGVQFFNEAGVKGFSIYHAHGTEEWRNVSDIFNASVVFELDEKDNPYGMDWIIWDKLTQRPPLVINFGEEGRATTFDRSLRIGKANSPVDENFTLCTTLACNSSDVADLEVEGSIWAGRNVTADYFIGDGSQLTGISMDNISLEFGDLVSEQNPDGYDAIRLKGTVSDVDIVLAGLTGYFNIWDALDNNVFSIDEDGNTVIGGYVDMTTNRIFNLGTPTGDYDATTKKYVDDLTDPSLLNNSMADALHRHSELSASDGTPDPALSVDATGQVGIGEINPSVKFEVNGGNGVIHGTFVSTDLISLISFKDSATADEVSVALGSVGENLTFYTSGNSRMTIVEGGDVGIGTSSPNKVGFPDTTVTIQGGAAQDDYGVLELVSPDVTGTNRFGEIRFENLDAGASPVASAGMRATRDGADDASALSFWTEVTGGSMTQKMTILSSGNVGIGTSSPNAELHIDASTAGGGDNEADLILESAHVGNAAPIGSIAFNNTDSISYTAARIDSYNNPGTDDGDLRFYTTDGGTLGNAKVTIDNSGNVGIGTTNPIRTLDVNGVTRISGGGLLVGDVVPGNPANPPEGEFWVMDDDIDVRFILGEGTSSGESAGMKWVSAGNYLSIYHSSIGTGSIVLDSSGNVGIGTTSPGDYYTSSLVVSDGNDGGITIVGGTTDDSWLMFADGTAGTARYAGSIRYDHNNNHMSFGTNGVFDLVTIDDGGDLILDTIQAKDGNGLSLIDDGGAFGLYVKDGGIIDTPQQPRARVYTTAGQTIGTSEWTNISWGFETFDTQVMHDTSTNNERIKVTFGGEGTYLITASITFGNVASGVRGIRLQKNGAGELRRVVVPAVSAGLEAEWQTVQVNDIIYLAENDYIEVAGWQDTGGDMTLLTGADRNHFAMIKLT